MTEETKTEVTENKPGPKPKASKIKNDSSRLITLIASRNDKVSILPTETKEVSKEFLATIKKNKAAMTFFDSGELKEV